MDKLFKWAKATPDKFANIRIDEIPQVEYTKKQLGEFALWFHRWMEGDELLVADMNDVIEEWEQDPDIDKL